VSTVDPSAENIDCAVHKSASKNWTSICEILKRQHKTTGDYEEAAAFANQCVLNPDIVTLLSKRHGLKQGKKLFDWMAFLARPVANCRMLHAIGVAGPHFCNIRITLVMYPRETSVPKKLRFGLLEAMRRLQLEVKVGAVEQIVSRHQDDFRRDCAEAYRMHAEIQLYMHFEDFLGSQPALRYMGASKKACFLCWNFLQALEEKIEVRGTHGVCFPAWGVPSVSTAQTTGALMKLRQVLETCIRKFRPFSSPTERTTQVQVVRQSTIVSALSQSPEEYLRQRQQGSLAEDHAIRLARQQQIM
jgi:hypothetical protein